MFLYEKIFEENKMVPWDPPEVPRVPILGPNRGMFSKLNGPGHLGSKGYPHTSFSSGKFSHTYKSFRIGVILVIVHYPQWFLTIFGNYKQILAEILSPMKILAELE